MIFESASLQLIGIFEIIYSHLLWCSGYCYCFWREEMETYCVLEFFMFFHSIGVLRGTNWVGNTSMNATET